MIRPTPDVIKGMATLVRQHPDLREWLYDWYRHELETLPLAINNTAVMQGRCQVLGELVKFVKDAPDHAAKLQ